MTTAATHRLSGCEGKVRFATFTLAKRTAHRQARRKDLKIEAYACQFCGGFHTGTHIGGADHPGGAPDGRQLWAVFAADPEGGEVLFGFSSTADGGLVASLVNRESGWRVTRVIKRRVAA